MAAEQFDAEFIERIVQEVIRRLLECDTSVRQAAACQSDELVLLDRVVTLETLRGKLNSVTRIAVAAKAIVTPAVKDELKDRGIELTRKQ